MVKLENNLKQKKTKIGILGGTFDPAHKGHLEISKQAKKILELKNIIWAITKQNPFKKTSKTKVKNKRLLEKLGLSKCEKRFSKTLKKPSAEVLRISKLAQTWKEVLKILEILKLSI